MIRAAVVAFSFNSLKLWRIPRHLKFCLPPRRRVMYFVRSCPADGKCRIPVRATTGSKYAVGGRCLEQLRPSPCPDTPASACPVPPLAPYEASRLHTKELLQRSQRG